MTRNQFSPLATTRSAVLAVLALALRLPCSPATAQTAAASNAPLPDIHELMKQVEDHQSQLDKVRENYTYTSLQTTQDIDASGQVKKTETEEYEVFFVNGHEVQRLVSKDGKPLDAGEDKKETGRVTKEVEKAQKTPSGQPMSGSEVSISKILSVMDVRNPRRDLYHGRPTIVFDFIGRKDAKTHGEIEGATKKLQGTLWIDEADKEVAHMDVSFDDNFKVAGGLVATIQKGSNFHFEQSPINGEIWLPVGADAQVQARVLLVKGMRQHFTERDSDFKRFHVETEQKKDAKAVAEKK